MGHIAIATDSTVNLPPELIEAHKISTIPLNIHWGEETYLDGVTLDINTFYQWLQERDDFPKTSQPSVGKFIEFFKGIAERFNTDTILGIFLSGELSGTLSSAMQAKAELPDLRIELVDSRSLSMGMGFQVLEAARASQEGLPLDAVLERVYQVRARTELFIALDTLEYLHRGGRIGGAARLLGTMLSFKPVLAVENGKIEALEKTRGRTKSLQKLIEIAEQRLAGRHPDELAIVHVGAEEEAALLKKWVSERIQPKRLYTNTLSPVLGTHGGPGAIGFSFYTKA